MSQVGSWVLSTQSCDEPFLLTILIEGCLKRKIVIFLQLCTSVIQPFQSTYGPIFSSVLSAEQGPRPARNLHSAHGTGREGGGGTEEPARTKGPRPHGRRRDDGDDDDGDYAPLFGFESVITDGSASVQFELTRYTRHHDGVEWESKNNDRQHLLALHPVDWGCGLLCLFCLQQPGQTDESSSAVCC